MVAARASTQRCCLRGVRARLYDRLNRTSVRDRVCMTVDDLPTVVLAAEDGGHTKADRHLLRAARQFGPAALDAHLVGEVGGLHPADRLEGVVLALTDLRPRFVHDPTDRV